MPTGRLMKNAHRQPMVSVRMPPIALGMTWFQMVCQRVAPIFQQASRKDIGTARVAEAVLSREAEFGVNLSGSTHPDLVSVPVVQDEFVLLCRDDLATTTHRLRGSTTLFLMLVAGFRLIYLLDGMGIETGVSLEKLVETAWFISDFLGRPPVSRVARALQAKRKRAADRRGTVQQAAG